MPIGNTRLLLTPIWHYIIKNVTITKYFVGTQVEDTLEDAGADGVIFIQGLMAPSAMQKV